MKKRNPVRISSGKYGPGNEASRLVSPGVLPAEHIPAFHLSMGNQAIRRLFREGFLQAKLKIGEPDDIYEREADRVAEQVMRMPEDSVISGQRSAIGKGKESGIQPKPG